jgi:hypothetical protein
VLELDSASIDAGPYCAAEPPFKGQPQRNRNGNHRRYFATIQAVAIVAELSAVIGLFRGQFHTICSQ